MAYRRMAAASQQNSGFREWAYDGSRGKAINVECCRSEIGRTEISALLQKRKHGEILRTAMGKPCSRRQFSICSGRE